MIRRQFTLAILLLFGVQQPLSAQNFVSDIKAAPQRYWNRTVEIEGQVTAVQAEFPGSPKGQYILVDESDTDGLLIRTKELPGPGQSFRVTGLVVQDKQNALLAVIQETERKPLGWRPPIWLYVVVGGLLVVLVYVLVVSMRQPKPATAMPAGLAPAPMTGSPMGAPMPPAYPIGPTAAEPMPPTIVFDAPASGTQVFLRARLRVTEGADAGKDFPLADSPLYIGRGRNGTGGRVNHVVLSDRTVSSAQATIRHDAAKDTFSLVNDSVTNRTTVDGEQRDVAPLGNGSVIQMGATTLVFQRD